MLICAAVPSSKVAQVPRHVSCVGEHIELTAAPLGAVELQSPVPGSQYNPEPQSAFELHVGTHKPWPAANPV
jgi:hypothetical protein